MSYQNVKDTTDAARATLVAVSKTKPSSTILELFDQGHRDFGENRVQELVSKYEELPKEIKWHLIGSLQSNKVKYIAPFVHLIHSVDSMKLVKTIIKEAAKNDRCIDILIQIKIASESSKQGIEPEDAIIFIDEILSKRSSNLSIRGLMAMATFTNDESVLKQEFQKAFSVFSKVKVNYKTELKDFNILSMGMSGDYKLALEHGSNMVRVGSLIFGER